MQPGSSHGSLGHLSVILPRKRGVVGGGRVRRGRDLQRKICFIKAGLTVTFSLSKERNSSLNVSDGPEGKRAIGERRLSPGELRTSPFKGANSNIAVQMTEANLRNGKRGRKRMMIHFVFIVPFVCTSEQF